eukprot:1023804-Pleurochrysis_carterae.AAC.1
MYYDAVGQSYQYSTGPEKRPEVKRSGACGRARACVRVCVCVGASASACKRAGERANVRVRVRARLMARACLHVRTRVRSHVPLSVLRASQVKFNQVAAVANTTLLQIAILGLVVPTLMESIGQMTARDLLCTLCQIFRLIILRRALFPSRLRLRVTDVRDSADHRETLVLPYTATNFCVLFQLQERCLVKGVSYTAELVCDGLGAGVEENAWDE